MRIFAVRLFLSKEGSKVNSGLARPPSGLVVKNKPTLEFPAELFAELTNQELTAMEPVGVYTSRMKPNPGEMVLLTAIPPGMLDDLPEEDQLAIKEIVGKPVLLNGYDDAGRAELEFTDRDGNPHFLFVGPEFIKSTY